MALVELDLTAGDYKILAEAGNDLRFTFTIALDTTGYTWEFRVYEANDNSTGPASSTAVATLTSGSGLTHTPGASSSSIACVIEDSVNTSARKGKAFWTELWRTDATYARTYGKGPIPLS